MAREFNGTSDLITFTVSTPLQTLVAGPTTMIAIINVLDTTDGAIMHFRTSGGTNGTWMEIAGGAWNYGQNVTPKALVVPSVSDGWAMYKAGKDAGGAALAAGRKVLMPSGTTTTATAGTGLADGTAPGSGGIFQVGKWGTASEYLRARIAALAIFNSHITNTTTIDSFATSYANLLAAGPIWCVHFNQASATDAITDDTGNGGNSISITGTTIVANPTGYFSSGITQPVNQASETDTAQPVTRQKIRVSGQPSETDTSQPITKSKTKAAGLTTETDAAQPITRQHLRALGQPSEADTAQPFSKRKTQAVGLISETDTTQSITRRKSKLTGITAETDTAQGFTRIHQRALGQATETDTVQTIARQKIKLIGQAVETDTAQTITEATDNPVIATAIETDTAQPVNRVKVKLLNQVVEASTSLAVGRAKHRSLSMASETDTAIPLVSSTRTLSQASETDSAQPITRQKIKVLGFVVETDSALAVGRQHLRVVGLSEETDTAQRILLPQRVTLGQAVETDTALPIVRQVIVLDPDIIIRMGVEATTIRFDTAHTIVSV